MKPTIRKTAAWMAAAVATAMLTSVAVPAIATAADGENAPFNSALPAQVETPKVRVNDAGMLGTVTARTRTQALAPAAAPTVVRTVRASNGSDLVKARQILAGLIAQYPILKGTTVTIGDAHGYQAVAFYRSGRIVVSPTHTATLERILNHEVWHIIDWRDNGRIDWGEAVPPR